MVGEEEFPDGTSIAEVLAGVGKVEGFPAFAPELAVENTDFPPDLFAALAAVEESSFWFLGRNRIVQWLFERFVGDEKRAVLEIGCGTGFVLRGLSERFADYELVGAEIYAAGLRFAQNRVPSGKFCQLDATRMPFKGQFDAVGCFDVLEHVEDDRLVLRGIAQALRPGGFLIITVPQHQWLWSEYDEAGDHKRRYARVDLKEKVREAGFRVVYVSSFVTVLLPALVFNRLLQRESGRRRSDVSKQAMKDLAPGMWVNVVGKFAVRIDELLIRLGISLPMGGSLALVAHKEADD